MASHGGRKRLGARSIAARALLRVERDGAFAAAALAAELERQPELDPRERALATELLYGTLRSRAALGARLLELAPKGISDPLVLTHLLVAAYQLLVLERIPGFAAVDAAVEEVGHARGPKVAGFANAVLRKLSASGQRLDRGQAVIESAPAWLLERLSAAVGEAEARALLGGEGGAPRPCLRIVGTGPLPDWLEQAEKGGCAPGARRLAVGSGDPRRLPGYAEGAFVVQEEGAQVVALALGARAGERVLDACAGRGQKTSQLREQVGAGSELWATDTHPRKLEQLRVEFERLKLEPPRTAAVDWTVGSGPVPDGFDRVLVDAPCSGSGTLWKRPEIAARLGPADPARLGQLAASILRNASMRVKSGGRVLFAVCSVLPEEGEAVIESVRDVLEPVPFDAPELAPLLTGGASSIRLLPRAHGTDGYFIASFCKR